MELPADLFVELSEGARYEQAAELERREIHFTSRLTV